MLKEYSSALRRLQVIAELPPGVDQAYEVYHSILQKALHSLENRWEEAKGFEKKKIGNKIRVIENALRESQSHKHKADSPGYFDKVKEEVKKKLQAISEQQEPTKPSPEEKKEAQKQEYHSNKQKLEDMKKKVSALEKQKGRNDPAVTRLKQQVNKFLQRKFYAKPYYKV